MFLAPAETRKSGGGGVIDVRGWRSSVAATLLSAFFESDIPLPWSVPGLLELDLTKPCESLWLTLSQVCQISKR